MKKLIKGTAFFISLAMLLAFFAYNNISYHRYNDAGINLVCAMVEISMPKYEKMVEQLCETLIEKSRDSKSEYLENFDGLDFYYKSVYTVFYDPKYNIIFLRISSLSDFNVPKILNYLSRDAKANVRLVSSKGILDIDNVSLNLFEYWYLIGVLGNFNKLHELVVVFFDAGSDAPQFFANIPEGEDALSVDFLLQDGGIEYRSNNAMYFSLEAIENVEAYTAKCLASHESNLKSAIELLDLWIEISPDIDTAEKNMFDFNRRKLK